jgi:hypothetical protein
MFSRTLLALPLAALSLVLLLPCAHAQTVYVNGKKVNLKTFAKGGATYVEIAPLVRAMGGQIRYDKATGRFYVTTGGKGGSGAATTPAATTTTTASAGTAQLAGDQGQFGEVYSIGKESPFYFRLTGAEYRVDRLRFGDTVVYPERDKKLLVLRFTIQNPQKREATLRWDSLSFTAVDSANVNHEYAELLGDERNSGQLDISLKPAQRVSAYTVIKVPANVSVPKLMVLPRDGSPVLRYDLRGKVKAVPAPFADPKDQTGAAALPLVTVPMGDYYPCCDFDVALEKAEYSTQAIREETLEEGERFLVLTVRVKNQSPQENTYRWDTFEPELRTTDGERLEYNEHLLLATSNREADLTLHPGEEVRVRYFYRIPEGATAKSFSLRNARYDGRTLVFELP